MITPSIKDYILKFVSIGDKPIKLSFILTKEKLKKFRLIQPISKIYFHDTKEIKENLDRIITSAINKEEYTDHDWIDPEDRFNHLSIIQERLTRTYHNIEEDESLQRVFLSKTYKEDKCVICQENNSNILFCDCGHQVICNDCFCVICQENNSNILFCDCGHQVICNDCFLELHSGKCPTCRIVNKIVRKI